MLTTNPMWLSTCHVKNSSGVYSLIVWIEKIKHNISIVYSTLCTNDNITGHCPSTNSTWPKWHWREPSRPSNEECIRLIHASTQLYECTQHPHSHTSTPIPPMYSTLPTNGNMTSYISSPDSQYSTLSNKTSDKLTIKKTTGQ